MFKSHNNFAIWQGQQYGGPLVSFEITTMNLNLSLKLSLTEFEFELEYKFEFEIEIDFKFEFEFKVAFTTVFSFLS